MKSIIYPTVNVHIDMDKHRAFVELNRPEKRNAMSPQLHEDMTLAFKEINSIQDIRVLVITGKGSSFCAGMDLEKFVVQQFDNPDIFMAAGEKAFKWFRELRQFRGVTIAAVNGWCVGGGMLVAGLCDIAVTANEAKFGLSEINFAVIPGAGLTWVTAKNLGRRDALFYLITGRLFDGIKAADMGFVNYAVPLDQLEAEVDNLSAEIASKNLHALLAIKQTYNGTVDLNLDNAIDYEMAKFFELSYLSREEWLRVALHQFTQKKFKPGLENYTPATN